MKERRLLKIFCVCLSALLVLSVALTAVLTAAAGAPTQPPSTQTAAPSDPVTVPTPAPTTEPTTQPTTAPTTAPTTEPATEPTSESTEAPSTEPQPERFVLSFVGDCTFGNLVGESSNDGFIGTVGSDYDYPFADIVEYFREDECTFVNLEGVLTERDTVEDRLFAFKGPPEYTQILVQGSVEFANVANNHRMDYGWGGYADTMDGLSAVGIHYADSEHYTVFTTAGGLRIGVFASRSGLMWRQISDAVAAMRAEGAELIIASMHWGDEYWYEPNSDQVGWARLAIDAGVDIVYGHHPHVLQPVEEYNGGIIYYSLGNFSYGGNYDPVDKDTAILQQEILRDPDGTVRLGELTVIPCYVSGINPGNDFQPTPMTPGTEAYARVLSKLDGTYPEKQVSAGYREDLTPPAPE